MGQLITIATLKGGSGKSTLASCLAVYWQLQGRRTAIVDADPQKSIVRMASRERQLAGTKIVEDSSDRVVSTARQLAIANQFVIIDTPGFRSPAMVACAAAADLLLVPVKPSPLDTDRMLDTIQALAKGPAEDRRRFYCLLTQTNRGSVIANHIRTELMEAGIPLLRNEMSSRVIYAEAALWGATPNLIQGRGAAAREIAAIAAELDELIGYKMAA